MPRLPFCALLFVPMAALAATPALPVQRQQELIRFVRQECGFCHGLHLTGGLGAALTPERMRDRPLDYLQTVILEGIPGTAMPGWAPYLGPLDARWVGERLREGFPR